MRFNSATSSDGVSEQLFTLGEVPGVLWTPEGAAGPRPLMVMGHGGGQHKKAPGIVARAHRFVTEGGFAVVAVDVPGHGDRPEDEEYHRIATENQARVDAGEELAPLIAAFQALVARQTVPEWRAVLDAVQDLDYVGAGPVGYWGVSLGCGLGVPFVAAEPRVRAAVWTAGCGSSPGTSADTAAGGPPRADRDPLPVGADSEGWSAGLAESDGAGPTRTPPHPMSAALSAPACGRRPAPSRRGAPRPSRSRFRSAGRCRTPPHAAG